MGVLQDNAQWVMEMHRDGLSRTEIAKVLGCAICSVSAFLKRNGVKLQKQNGGILERNKDKVIDLLDKGYSAYKIANIIGCKSSSVNKFVKKYSLVNKNKCTVNYNNLLKDKKYQVIELYNSGKSVCEVAKIVGHSQSNVNRLLHDSGIEIRDYRYDVDETFFDSIDTEAKAYVLGWFYSDGCVDEEGKMRIQIQAEDDYMLHTIKRLMQYDGPLYDVPPPKKFPHRKPQTVLSINRKVMADKLIALGCIPNKSLTLQFPSSDIVPPHLLHHFIRGVFDGDGSVSVKGQNKTYVNCSITSCEDFIQPLRDFLFTHFKIETKHYYRHTHTNTITMMITKTAHAQHFLHWIYGELPGYQEATFYLARKFDKFHEHTPNGV